MKRGLILATSSVAILLLVLVAASSQNLVAEFNWDASTPDTMSQEVDSDTFIFKVTTTERVTCRYDDDEGKSYSSMTGRFDENLETVHKETFTEVSDGVYRYYVKCKSIDGSTPDGTAELEAIITVDSRIMAIITIDSDEDVLTEGKYNLELVTSEIPIETPTLIYTYDGEDYETIALHGSETEWEGTLIIPSSVGEDIGSFEFSAQDLEGESGTKIYSGKTFEVDTTAPKTITDVSATGEYGQIELVWTIDDDDVEGYRIYRSEDAGVTESDLYKRIDSNDDEENYYDTNVDKGETYYYRIAAVDSAGNLADLSREVSATARKDNTNTDSGLSSELVSLVDAVLTEIDLAYDDLDDAKSELESFEDSEQSLLEIIGISSDLNSVSTELSTLEKEVTNYKLQDLTSTVLDTRLSSARVKLTMIKKKIPSSISLTTEESKAVKISDDDIRTAILEYAPELTSSKIDKAIKQSQKLIEENDFSLTNSVSVFEIVYLDGSSEKFSIVKHQMGGTLEGSSTSSIILSLPSTFTSSEIDMKNINYEEVGDNLYRFGADTKAITYIISGDSGSEILSDAKLAVLEIEEDEDSLITGYFLSNVSSSGSIGLTLLILAAVSLVAYLGIMKRKQESESVSDFLKKAHEVKSLQSSGKTTEAGSLYDSLKMDYMSLSDDEKAKVFDKIKHLHKK